MSIQEHTRYLLRKTLLKKGSSSNSFPKTFSMKFQPHRVHIPDELDVQKFLDAPYGAEICIKSLWKGGRVKPFLRKVSPDKYI